MEEISDSIFRLQCDWDGFSIVRLQSGHGNFGSKVGVAIACLDNFSLARLQGGWDNFGTKLKRMDIHKMTMLESWSLTGWA